MVVRAKWTVDISLDSSVVEHLTSDAGDPGSIPGPAIYFHLYFFVFVHSSHPYYTRFIKLEGVIAGKKNRKKDKDVFPNVLCRHFKHYQT